MVRPHGGMAERSKAHAWKVCIRQNRIVGSNPTPSAILFAPGASQDGSFAGARSRMPAEHNAGQSPHTSKFMPWRLVTYVAFSADHAVARKRLW